MAAEKKVIWTETAKNEFKHTCSYWNKRNASTAYSNRLRKLLKSNLQKIILFPKSGIPTAYKGIRFIVIRDYLLFYCETPGHIIIVSFWDARQDPSKLSARLS